MPANGLDWRRRVARSDRSAKSATTWLAGDVRICAHSAKAGEALPFASCQTAHVLPRLVQQGGSGPHLLGDKLMQGQATLVEAVMIAVKRFHNRDYSTNQRRKEPRRARLSKLPNFPTKTASSKFKNSDEAPLARISGTFERSAERACVLRESEPSLAARVGAVPF
jgi:hypothetical protein